MSITLITENKLKAGDFFTIVERKNTKDRSYINDTLECLAVDGNLAVVRRLGAVKFTFTMDLNTVRTRPLSVEYVTAATAPYR